LRRISPHHGDRGEEKQRPADITPDSPLIQVESFIFLSSSSRDRIAASRRQHTKVPKTVVRTARQRPYEKRAGNATLGASHPAADPQHCQQQKPEKNPPDVQKAAADLVPGEAAAPIIFFSRERQRAFVTAYPSSSQQTLDDAARRDDSCPLEQSSGEIRTCRYTLQNAKHLRASIRRRRRGYVKIADRQQLPRTDHPAPPFDGIVEEAAGLVKPRC